ncbi:DNA-binding barrel domain superfamily [Sesbania bispinosa]|nr:DNA-binding barrel domain superfamily [Sesbania bispinosa]
MAYTDCSNVCTHLTLGTCVWCRTVTKTETKPNVCVDLSLGVCLCTTTESGSSSKKRKHDHKAHIGSRKKACSNEVDRRWGYSTELMLYDDPWKIKKVLKESDLGNMSRLLLGRDLAQELVLSVLGADADLDNGTQVMIKDVDTNSMHSLLFKKWVSSRSYVFIGSWVQDFVIRRALKKGDEIGLHWDPYNNLFNFSVLKAI